MPGPARSSRLADDVAAHVLHELDRPRAESPPARIHRSTTADTVRRTPAHHIDAPRSGEAIDVIMSWLLDQNVFEMEVLLSGDSEPTLNREADLAKHELSVDDVVEFLRVNGAPDESAPAEERLAFLSNVIGLVPHHLTTMLSDESETAGGDAASTVQWAGLTPWGAGTGVTLSMRPGGMPAGSEPNADPAWIKTIEGHLAPGGNTSIYVRGHLLNHNIGGPGLDYNMVPLTGKAATNAGGNDANAVHLNVIEKEAKQTWDAVRTGKLGRAEYTVEAEFGRSERSATSAVRRQAELLSIARHALAEDLREQVYELSNDEAREDLSTRVTARGIDPESVLKMGGTDIPDELVDELVVADHMSDHGASTLSALLAAQPKVAEILAGFDLDIARASLNGADPLQATLDELLGALTANAAVWAFEEQHVPTGLHVRLQKWGLDGTSAGPRDADVPIALPTDPARVYYRPAKKGELA